MIKEQTLKNMSIPCIFIYLIISLYSIYQYLKTSIDFISGLGNNIFMNRENISLEDELKTFIVESNKDKLDLDLSRLKNIKNICTKHHFDATTETVTENIEEG